MASRVTCREVLKANVLMLLTTIGVGLGFAIGFGVREYHPSEDARMWIGLPGEIFLRLLKMMILPLVVSSVISGTASLDPQSNWKISLIAFIWIVSTNLLGCILGAALTVVVKPGVIASENITRSSPATQQLQTQDIFADLIRNIFPDNVVTACFTKTQTYYEAQTVNNESSDTYTRKIGNGGGTNLIGLIFCCVLFGIAASSVGDIGRPVCNFFRSSMEIVLKLLRWFLWYTPIGVASLIAYAISGVDDLAERFHQLGLLVAIVTAGLLFQQLVFIPLVYVLCFFENPIWFLINVFPAWCISFATTSTSMGIPEMIRCAENGHGVDARVSRFVILFSCTLSKNGSGLFVTSAIIFIGQMNGIDMDVEKVVIIGVLTAVAMMAVPSVPSASIVVVILILEAVSIPVEDVALLLTIEWYMDRIRSTSNAVSHTFCALFTYRWCKNTLRATEEADVMLHGEKEKSILLSPVDQRRLSLDVKIDPASIINGV